MSQYVAFLRAINVGGHTVKMDYLRKLFAEQGFTRVETFIASGNVIFDAPDAAPSALEASLAAFLHARLGYAVATFIRSLPELSAVVAYRPFSDAGLDTPGHSLYVGFLSDTPGEATQNALRERRTPVDDFHCHEREL